MEIVKQNRLTIALLLAAVIIWIITPSLYRDNTATILHNAAPDERIYFLIPINKASKKEIIHFFGTTKLRAEAIINTREEAPFTADTGLERVPRLPDAEKERMARFIVYDTEP